ncbi:unnamed protein product [Lactuca virosa]|uniref:Protein RIK n=1 Tax=Lactuca virosa TaxID=75947 RepID=A0AAU9LJ78_9ASTR|nr:unnamed protein product [Lactuca virosa]
MTEDDCARVSMPDSTPASDSSNTKQRKKRKWDQPAESLVTAGEAVPGVLPLLNMGSFVGITHPGVPPASGASLINPLTSSYGHLQQLFPAPSMQQHATALAQKIQPKIQEELIAREIVINDAESSIRYKLTKRQTQEEIQKCTGAIVITRGKYRPPNAPSDGEKPLYLHVSAGTHLETTADRIKAVDQAAAMIEEIMKQGVLTNGLKVVHPFSTCVFLGFEPDPSLNIIARIRGPNDQYVNHIMNETGSTVLLKGRGSGNPGISNSEEQQSLHLFLSSSNPKSLEHAKLLAENLLDTICAECGASRVSSCKVYGAVPPPPPLLTRVQSELETASSVTTPGGKTVISHITPPPPPPPPGTSYNGYGGIYPQATPLQQVALALKQSTSPIISTQTQIIGNANLEMEKEKRPPHTHTHKRKFQELPVTAHGQPGQLKTHQASGILKQNEVNSKSSTKMESPIPIPIPMTNGMMPPPPRPPKFNSTAKVVEGNIVKTPETKSVPETLISLMEYGDEEEDDDIEETNEETLTNNSKSKPFWAV